MSEVPAGMHGKRRANRIMGLCQDCGGPLDRPGMFVRCNACRKTRSEYVRAYNALQREIAKEYAVSVSKTKKRDAEIAIEQEKLKMRIQKCVKCEWAKVEDSIIFCPFMEGICQKGVYKHGSKNQGQRTEDAV